MSFIVDLYSLSKKENSTKQPTGATSFNCVLKEQSGIINPIIILDIGLASNPSQYNYCYIRDFNRYYWIKEWVNDRALWIASLDVDVLATYKTAIGNHDLYVLRASNEFDGSVIDTLYPTKVLSSYSRQVKPVLNNDFTNDSVFVIGVVNELGSFGSLQYYIVNRQQLDTLCYYLVKDAIKDGVNGFTLNDCSIALQKSLIDPLSYIKFASFIPIDRADLPIATVENIKIMDWDTGVQGRIVEPQADIVKLRFEFDLPKHPQASDRGIYCNASPYTIYTLKFLPFGEIALENLSMISDDKVIVKLDVELHTGAGVLTVESGGVVLNRLNGQIGVDINLSQVTRDYLGTTQNILGSVGSAVNGVLTKNPMAVIGMADGILSAVQTIQPKVYNQGSNGTLLSSEYPMELESRFFTIVDDDINCNGRPLCKIRKPSELGGYMLIQDADISISATEYELNKIRAYLESGFYYE